VLVGGGQPAVHKKRSAGVQGVYLRDKRDHRKMAASGAGRLQARRRGRAFGQNDQGHKQSRERNVAGEYNFRRGLGGRVE
jgi:hypothetical protein